MQSGIKLLLPLRLANTEGSRRGETSVSRDGEIQPNNDPNERYKTVVQKGVAEGGKGKKRKRGEENGWESRSERGDPF